MNKKTAIVNLSSLNILLALVVSVVVFLFQLLTNNKSGFINFPVMGFVIVLAVGTINILWIKQIQHNPSKIFFYYLLSYFSGAAVYLIVWPPFSYFINAEWSYQDYNLFFALILSSAVLNTTILLFQHFVILQQDKLKAEIQVSKLKAANTEASNFLLRQQIQPHFLFNSLSNLKALYNENHDIGETYLVLLANYLRASISNQNKKTSLLNVELDFLNNYLEMQKMRFGNALEYSIVVKKEVLLKYSLPTFSLQLLVENAIKHNEITVDKPLMIKIIQQNTYIIITNNIQIKQSPYVSTGQGLANLSERYRLLSGDDIEIKQNLDMFSVTLKLLQNENFDN